MTKRERFSATTSSLSTGRCAMSTVLFLSHGRPLYDACDAPSSSLAAAHRLVCGDAGVRDAVAPHTDDEFLE